MQIHTLPLPSSKAFFFLRVKHIFGDTVHHKNTSGVKEITKPHFGEIRLTRIIVLCPYVDLFQHTS